MPKLTLTSLEKVMKKIDICMMSTITKAGIINSRPMSNNRDVTYKGDSYFFTFEKTTKIKELKANTNVSLQFAGPGDLYIMVSGKAKLIKDKAMFEAHWDNSLDQWFENGIETKGIILIHVKAAKISYWQNQFHGELSVGKK